MKNTKMMGLIIIVVIAVAIGGLKVTQKEKTPTNNTNSSTPSETSDQPNTSETSNTPASNNSSLKDGTYTANGTYQSPGGNESIDVTVTIKDNKIVTTEAEPQAASRESMQYQDDFVSGYKAKVVGKDISSLKLSKVSGSSLTSQGFNKAIEKIRTQAQS